MGGGNAKQAKPTQGVTPDDQTVVASTEDDNLDAGLDFDLILMLVFLKKSVYFN